MINKQVNHLTKVAISAIKNVARVYSERFINQEEERKDEFQNWAIKEELILDDENCVLPGTEDECDDRNASISNGM